jgi:phosphate transport system protein
MSEHGHIVHAFGHELKRLSAKILEMGGLAEKQLADAVSALINRDAELASAVIGADEGIDKVEAEIEDLAVLMILKRQPVAVDLRQIIAALRIATELERVGDFAKNIAKRVTAIGTERQPRSTATGVQHMAEIALHQIRDVLDAYVSHDAAKAVEVRRRDQEIDALYTSVFRELLTYMMEDPRNITMCTHLLFCAKNMERIGDHTTNIAETVYYVATGSHLRGERPKGDETSVTAVPFTPGGAREQAS